MEEGITALILLAIPVIMALWDLIKSELHYRQIKRNI